MFNDERLYKLLEKVKENPETVLTNKLYCEYQWIQFNVQKRCFEYEDGTFLGYLPSEVIKLFKDLISNGWGELLETEEWIIKPRINLNKQ